MPRVIDPFDARFVAAYVTVVVFACVLLFARRAHRGVLVALLAFLALVLPMLGLVQNGPQIAADRYTYHAAPALALLAGGIFLVVGARLVTTLAVGAALVVTLSGALTWRQTTVWADSNSLWQHVVDEEPQSSIGHSSLASLFFEQNRVTEAADQSALALGLDSSSASAHNAVGMSLALQGHPVEAIAQYQRAIELSPLDDQAENNWGITLARQGDAEGAIQHYQRALFLNPDNASAQVNWGNALVRLNRFADAIPHYREALEIQPNNADAHHNWGVALARQGLYGEAVDQFRAALNINPSHAEARDYLQKASALAR
jgi:tetratricopeptide (TPR) repeat protein